MHTHQQNILTNVDENKDETYKKAVYKHNRQSFFYTFCRRTLRLANEYLIKKHHIKIIVIKFWDMETDTVITKKVEKFY